MRLLLPLYVHPLVDPAAWDAVAAYGGEVTVVVNVHDGPGAGPDEAYITATRRLHDAGVPTLGYVDLDYGTRADDDVWRDVVGWARYRPGGVFFDQAPSGWEHFEYVSRVADAVPGTVVLNPGTRCHVGYGAVADLVCTFEGPWNSYVDSPVDDWGNSVHLVYGVPPDLLDVAGARVASRVGCGMVTDLDMPLPYLGLPPVLREPAPAP